MTQKSEQKLTKTTETLKLGIWNFLGAWRLGFGTSAARSGMLSRSLLFAAVSVVLAISSTANVASANTPHHRHRAARAGTRASAAEAPYRGSLTLASNAAEPHEFQSTSSVTTQFKEQLNTYASSVPATTAPVTSVGTTGGFSSIQVANSSIGTSSFGSTPLSPDIAMPEASTWFIGILTIVAIAAGHWRKAKNG